MTDVHPSHSDLESSQGLSVVQMSMNQPVQVQSVIHNQPSVIQTAGPNVQTIQVVRVAPVDEELTEDPEGKRRREILSRRPSYRKILNELSSSVQPKIEEESNSSQSQDGESPDTAANLSSSTNQLYQQVMPGGAIQITTNPEGQTSVSPGLQTFTMSNASPTTSSTTQGATIVQYAQGPDGQFYIPGAVQAYQIASGSLPQGVVMATTGSPLSGSSLSEEASRKRELRLLKNREAARECRLKKKEYVKCLENRVAVLENQNKTLIEELKALKELYCEKEG